MPIPGSVLDGMNFAPANVGTIPYASVCTFLHITKTQASDGQELHSFATIDAAHTNVPCRKSALRQWPMEQEKSRADFQETLAEFWLSLNKYLGDVVIEWRVTVDGVIYEILAVEPDGNNLATRLRIGVLTPYNG